MTVPGPVRPGRRGPRRVCAPGFREDVGDHQRPLFLLDHAGLPLSTVLEQLALLGGELVPVLRHAARPFSRGAGRAGPVGSQRGARDPRRRAQVTDGPTGGVDVAELSCLALNCSLKREGTSSTEVLLHQVLGVLADHDVAGDVVRVAALDVHPGVTSEPQGPGDDWPGLRERILAADIVLLGSPIWLGNPSSVCRRVLERMDAFLGETDDAGRMVTFGKVGGVAVTGNEDGAHNVIAQCYQGLADVGFTIPTNAATYWVGEAMGQVDYADLEEVPDAVASTTRMMATNLAHVARLLRAAPYPPPA